MRMLWLVGVTWLTAMFVGELAFAADHPRPNIVLIFADDLGYGDIGPFGNTQVKTPYLDRMATEGRKFTSFYATPVCSMSRACLLTGCYNIRVSVPGVLFPRDNTGLHPQEVTLAEVVKAQGYATTCIGKWHLGHRTPFLPTRQGFDSYFGIPYSNDMTIDPQHARFASECVFREGMTPDKARSGTIPQTVPLMRGEEIVEYPADQSTLTRRYTQEATQFIRDHREQPFFVYLPHAMVHVPLAASDEFRGHSRAGLLGDAIEELDWSVGEILRTLSELHLDEKTLVIFTSDNGAARGSSAPWRGKKGSVYEGGVREPCIMRWTGQIPPGTSCSQIAGNIDLLPTFAELVGAELPPDRTLDGCDIRSLMLQADSPPVRDTHLHFTRNGALGAIRQGDWKLVLPVELPFRDKPTPQRLPKISPTVPELYQLADDPSELTNIAEKHPEIVTRLMQAARERDTEIRTHRRPAGTIPTARVWLLGGQSNMQGTAKISELPQDFPRALPHAHYWNGKRFEPLVLGQTRTSRDGEFGPEVGFARSMATETDPAYIIKYHASGMPLHHGWHGNTWASPEHAPNRRNFYPGESSSDPNTGTLYREMLTHFRAGITHLDAAGITPEIEGFLWMQGEQDAKHEDSASGYGVNLERLRRRLAEDLECSPALPVVFGQVLPHDPPLPRFTHRDPLRALMAAIDRDSGAPESNPHFKMVSTDGYGVLADTVHYNTEGQLRLGADMVRAMKDLKRAP